VFLSVGSGPPSVWFQAKNRVFVAGCVRIVVVPRSVSRGNATVGFKLLSVGS
jgi:hypothetical protein